MGLKNPEAAREYQRQWRAKNREKARKSNRIWYSKNREQRRLRYFAQRQKWLDYARLRQPQIREKRRVYYRKNRERLLQYQRVWRLKNPTKYRNRSRNYVRKHSHAYAAHSSKRRALLRGMAVGNMAAVKAVYRRAKELRQWFDVVVDHIMPLARGGAHSADNLQIIYWVDNARKHVNLDYKPRVVFV